MKQHIENLNIIIHQHQPAGLIAGMALASANKPAFMGNVPAIGDKWPGTDAIYAGISLSESDDSLVHLILWPNTKDKGMAYDQAVKFAREVNPKMNSHIPTRHQSITLFERLREHFNQDYYHWTMTKSASGETAFVQLFNHGTQSYSILSAECRVRAVSEIQL